MTAVELLVAMTLLIAVIGTLFSAFDGFGRATRANLAQNEAQSVARTAVDRMAKELRNSSSLGLPNTPVERAGTDDLVYLRFDPSGPGGSNTRSISRVRYCLNNSSKLWKQVQTWTTASPPSLPGATACPDSSFGSQASVSEYVVNEANSQNRPVFTYDSASPSQITSVTVELFTDTLLTQPPGEQRLKTTIFLRNKNRPPSPSFSASLLGNQHVLLNASASQDPDEDDLTYTWYDGSTQVGTGVLFDYKVPTTGAHSFSLTVTDPAGLSTTSPVQSVNVT